MSDLYIRRAGELRRRRDNVLLGPAASVRRTRLLTQFHTTDIIAPMETFLQRSFEGTVAFNDTNYSAKGPGAVGPASDDQGGWFFMKNPSTWFFNNGGTPAGTPPGTTYVRPWVAANPAARGYSVATQQPFLYTHDTTTGKKDGNSGAQEVIAGARDADIVTWTQNTLAGLGPNAVIRLGHELNMFQQYAWGPGNTTDVNYVAACRKWIDVARTVPGHAFKWEWNVLPNGDDPTPRWWGDTYVDIIGTDLYGSIYKTTNPSDAEMFGYINTGSQNGGPVGYALNWLKALCELKDKPYSFSEYAMFTPFSPAGVAKVRGSSDSAGYVNQMFDFIAANNGVANARPNVYCTHHAYYNRPDGAVEVTLDGFGGTPAMPATYAAFRTRVQALHP